MSEAHWTRTTCPYCGVGCGVLARAAADGKAEIKGDPDHPANHGRLCSKGSALGDTVSLEGRLLAPRIGGREARWDEALDLVAAKFRDAIDTHGPDSVALYVSGQLLTEDYYVANKLMKGFVGTANIDTNSRLCMASSVAGHKRAFGSDTVPGTYEDLEQADLVVLVGSNLAWCHPVLFQRLAAARERRGTKVVVVDPRRTATAEIADLHLPIRPGTDVALFNGLFASLGPAGAFDREYVVNHTGGLDEALAEAVKLEIDDVAHITGLARRDLYQLYDLFAENERVVTVYSQGVNQSTAGTDKVNAIINCHLATGRIGKPGTGPFSVTGQPNAMGGRETGGLANMLAAHMDIDNDEHRQIVSSFWQTDRLAAAAGLKAVDLFEAVADGRIKALWIMATNPVDSLPDADAVRAALAGCPFVVVSDVVAHTDTTAQADVLLPAAAWGEKDGTVTNSERRISRQRPFLPLPGEARPDWWQLAQVAARLGFADAFAYTSPAEIYAEYAALTGAGNGGTRDLDISAHAGIDQPAYDALVPFQWPLAGGDMPAGDSRFFANGGFFTPNRRARFVTTPYRPALSQPTRQHPAILNTGRIRDQWHTMTRTARAPRLNAHIAEPFVEVHPDDAVRWGLEAAGIAEVESALGRILARVSVSDRQQQGSVFVPMHWTDQFATSTRVGTLIAPNTDPVSGQPELKHAVVTLRPFNACWYGFAVTRRRPELARFDYAALARVENGYRLETADAEMPRDWSELAVAVLNPDGAADVTLAVYEDGASGAVRHAAFEGDRCVGLFYAARSPVKVARTWAAEQLGSEVAVGQRLALLAGRPGAGAPDRGAIVCSCFGVGRNEIARCAEGGCRTVDDIGAALSAGTNCGSCRSEIQAILNQTAPSPRLQQRPFVTAHR